MKKLMVDLNELTMEGLKAYFQLLKEGATDISHKEFKDEEMEEIEPIPEPPKDSFNVQS